MDEDDEKDWDRILYDGDRVTVTLMAVDPKVYNYLSELGSGQYHGANPHSNISGGCLGYFAAGSITHADTIVFSRDNIEDYHKKP